MVLRAALIKSVLRSSSAAELLPLRADNERFSHALRNAARSWLFAVERRLKARNLSQAGWRRLL